MIHLIRADLRRILRKKSFYIALAVAAVLSVLLVLWDRTHLWNGFAFAVHEKNYLLNGSTVILGIAVFSVVYTDEFRAKSMQAAIGRGVTRGRIIAAKIADVIALTAIIYGCFSVFLLLLSLAAGAHMTAADLKILLLTVLMGAYTVICCAPLAAVILYITDNSALAVFIMLLLTTVIPTLSSFLDTRVLFHNAHITHYMIQGFANRAFSDMMLGGNGAATLLLGAVIYLGLALLLSVLAFRRKELDF